MLKTLLRIHFIGLGLALADLVALLSAGISFRGQVMDIALTLAPFLSAVVLLAGYYSRLGPALRIYVSVFFVVQLLLMPLYLASGAFFIQPVYDRSGPYEARQRRGILAPEEAVLTHAFFVFERETDGFTVIDTSAPYPPFRARIIFRNDSVGIRQ